MTKKIEAYGNTFDTTGTRVNASGETEVKATAGTLERIIVNDNGADCTMTIKNGSSTLGVTNTLTGDIPRVIECGFTCDDSIKITLGGSDPAEHWYKLDSTSGSTATDSGAGTAANLTLTNMEDGDWESGKIGQCLHFDGVDENIETSTNIISTSSSAWSISFWLWLDTLDSIAYLVSQGAGDDFWIRLLASGYTNINIAKSGSQRIYVSFDQSVMALNTWYLFTVTYDGSNKAAGVNLYINGAKRDLTVAVDTLTPDVWTGNLMFMCGGVDGKIDDIRVYDVELTEDEVDWIRNEGEGRSDDYTMADVLVIWE